MNCLICREEIQLVGKYEHIYACPDKELILALYDGKASGYYHIAQIINQKLYTVIYSSAYHKTELFVSNNYGCKLIFSFNERIQFQSQEELERVIPRLLNLTAFS